MARIRTIKPEFFTSEDIVSLTPLARLFYVSLWCEADREGRLSWKLRTLKLRYLPADSCDVMELAQELIDAELIELYTVDGKEYAQIPSFAKHQIINNRESESTIPSKTSGSKPKPRDASGTRESGVQGEGKGRKGKEGDSTEPQDDSMPPALPPVVSIPLIDKSEFDVTQAMVDEWSATFPAVDVTAALLRMRTWCNANPAQRKTPRGIQSFIVRWLGKEQDSGRGGRPQTRELEGVGTFV